jgi:AAHS family 4-hydroxybenzoate transporter-like MFS transporter
VQDPKTFDVSNAIEAQKIGRFTAGLIVVSWLVTFFDGFDMNVIAFTSERMQDAFHLSRSMMSLVFSAGIFGTIFGGVVFGFAGDRVGRRPAIIAATACFSALTILLALAQSAPQLLLLRFLNGVALGGAMPLIWALNIEFSPRRFRATAITLIMLGYGFGVAASGPIARLILPRYDWPGVFVFGGAVSFLAVLLLIATLPESIRLLALKGRRPDLIVRSLGRMGVAAPADAAATTFVVTDEAARRAEPFQPKMLFQGQLKWLTPLVWLAYFFSSISTFFQTTWGPQVLHEMGFSLDHAAWLSSLNSLCGMAGGLAVMRFTDRHGPISIAILPIIAVPLLLVAGLTPMSLGIFFYLNLAVAFFLSGGHFGITSIVGLFYPSGIRANGTGWANAVAKWGSVLGPTIGGLVLVPGQPVKWVFALLAVCPAVFGSCIIAIGLISRRDWSKGPSASDPATAPASAPAE